MESLWANLALGITDLIVLVVLLTGPPIIGSVSAFRQPSRSVRDFLVGNRALRVLPTALSLVASNMSGVTVLGYPAEIYGHGTQFAGVALGALLATIAVIIWYLPIFFNLQVTSSYEYLEKRFDIRVRRTTSILFILRLVLYLPVVLYVPAITLNQVFTSRKCLITMLSLMFSWPRRCYSATGISVTLAVPVLAFLATCYTIAGGLRAVALTGSLQVAIMFLSILAMNSIGLIKVGGFHVVWQRMQDGGRLQFADLSLNPLKRTTLWSSVVGGAFFWLQMLGVQPNSVQRYVAVPTITSARKSAVIQCVGLVVNTLLCCLLGAVIFACYHDCDPVAAKVVSRVDQIVPHFVLDVSRNLPGLAGFFMAGVCSAALGNLSAGLHTLATTIHRDFVQNRTTSSRRDKIIVRLLVVIAAIWTVAGSLLIGRLGGVVQAAMSLGGISSGTLLGVFTLGMFFAKANTKGALVGAAVSLTTMILIGGGAQVATTFGYIRNLPLPTRTDGCYKGGEALSTPQPAITSTLSSLLTTVTPTESHKTGLLQVSEAPALLRLSYLWYVTTGCAIVLVVGSAVSLLTGETATKGPIEPMLLVPCFRRKNERQTTEEIEELQPKTFPGIEGGGVITVT